jgi:hypothetical protein
MITVQPFSMSVLGKAKHFFALRHINGDSLEIVRRTPAGDDVFNDANVYRMENGQLVVTLDHPFAHLGNLVLIAKAEGVEEIINLEHFERIIEFYDRSPDVVMSEVGVFVFCKSEPIYDPAMEWRCDNTMYGARAYETPSVKNPQLVSSLDDIIMYEPVLTVPAVGHLLYIHFHNDEILRRDFIDDAELPIGAYTLGEMFRLLHEWSAVHGEPFNNQERIAGDAQGFLSALEFDAGLIAGQPEMQISSFLRGKENARQRPLELVPTSEALLQFVRERMAYSSLSALSIVFPGLVDTATVLKEEQRQLHIGIQKFRDYYGVGLEIPLTDENRVIERATEISLTNPAYIHNQLRMFRNKREVLDRVSYGNL